MSSDEIVSWICHICADEFDTPDGGICNRCQGVTCRSHLTNIGTTLIKDAQWVCNHCLTDEEKGKISRFWLKSSKTRSKKNDAKDQTRSWFRVKK